jgi:hypothetical protein
MAKFTRRLNGGGYQLNANCWQNLPIFTLTAAMIAAVLKRTCVDWDFSFGRN